MSTEVKTLYGVNFCNTYLFSSGKDMAVVDPSEIPKNWINGIKNLRYILLTHDHFDHIMQVNLIKKHFPEAKVVVHSDDVSGLSDSEINQGKLFGYETEPVNADIIVNGGESLPFGDTEINVIHTPGHTDGSVCYLCQDVLFSGDTLFSGSIGRTDFSTGSMEKMLNSLKVLGKLKDDIKVFPGHGEKTEIGTQKRHNPFFSL